MVCIQGKRVFSFGHISRFVLGVNCMWNVSALITGGNPNLKKSSNTVESKHEKPLWLRVVCKWWNVSGQCAWEW